MKTLLKFLPLFFVALFAIEIIAVFAPKKEGEFHTREFGRLPVLMNGRVQPLDSVGKNTLLQLRGTGDVPLEEVPSWKFWHHGKKLKPSEWLLEVLFKPDVADTRPVFLIHHPELLAELNLRDKGIEKSALRYFTFNELRTVRTASSNLVAAEIMEQAGQVQDLLHQGTPEKQLTSLQQQVLKIAKAISTYMHMKSAVIPSGWGDLPSNMSEVNGLLAPGAAAMRAQQAGQPYNQHDLDQLREMFTERREAGQTFPLVIPPANPEEARDEWTTAPLGVLESVRMGNLYPPVKFFREMAAAFREGNAAEFNGAVAGYKDWLSTKFARELKKGREEFFYNDIKAFLHAMIMYLFAFVLVAVSLLTLGSFPNVSNSFRRSAFWLVVLAWLLHTFALIFRMYLEGRPPVTNLYSSAIFIGWGAIVLGLALEIFFRVGIGVAVAALTGGVTLIIAHNLALSGDTMEMLRAVLDTNFWLATHVVVITSGYASTFVAGLLGITYVLLGVFTPVLRVSVGKKGAAAMALPVTGLVGAAAMAKAVENRGTIEVGKALAKMAYAIVCAATLFSFVGTVLGGIWADQSWGRFWGWDPKENGALIIVLWNAVVLHARWGGLVKERGVMNMVIVGNIVTSWSWFGVNMLGVGLHSYGFMDEAFRWLVAFIASQVFLIGLGLLPQRLWKSFRGTKPPSDSPSAPKSVPELKPA
jgi:ABC-type transport system involved in cytochrome c biogenesis permease subunit